MKRTLILMAALPILLLAGCKKAKVDPTRPGVTWETNSGFATKELTADLDARVTVSAPGKFKELSLVLGLGQYNILANQYIRIGNNKGTGSSSPVLDLLDDDSSISFLRGLGMQAGAGLKEKEQVVLDLKAILQEIIKGQLVDNNTTFTVEVRVKDQADQTISKTARFHFTQAPMYSWAKNSDFSTVDLDAAEIECKVQILAPGKIEELTVKLQDGAAQHLVNYVKNRTTDGKTLIDLVGDSKVVDSFKGYFPAGSAVQGKEEVVLDFSFMYGMKYDLTASTNVFTITTKDKNGKETVQQVRFVKK